MRILVEEITICVGRPGSAGLPSPLEGVSTNPWPVEVRLEQKKSRIFLSWISDIHIFLFWDTTGCQAFRPSHLQFPGLALTLRVILSTLRVHDLQIWVGFHSWLPFLAVLVAGGRSLPTPHSSYYCLFRLCACAPLIVFLWRTLRNIVTWMWELESTQSWRYHSFITQHSCLPSSAWPHAKILPVPLFIVFGEEARGQGYSCSSPAPGGGDIHQETLGTFEKGAWDSMDPEKSL